ncbi:glutamate mutase L [Patescibacteria group bacterium]|nr:glutamate mutase L [Patescibacteria group bacterium]
MKYILATDVGSTTTKARFFMKNEEGEWRFLVAGEAPTTVETPYEDVTLGVRNAVREIEELTSYKILSEEASGIVVPFDGERGVDLYCTTSSAGGGLQMMVAGNVKSITAESANRAALGAGAIVMDVIAIDDGREDYEKIRRIRTLRPDMILLAGGTDGGTIFHVLMIAELVKAAKPMPRLGMGYNLPVIFAGNKDARPQVKELLGEDFSLSVVDNLRPVLEKETIEPTRRNIHELFMEHVMSHAPGYTKLTKWTDIDIMPTPAGEGMAMQLIANAYKSNILGVGLGGATTNIYSIFDGRLVRSVSANLGMSYSICNVLKEATVGKILRWVPFGMEEKELINMLRNKMIRPTTIPQTLKELIIEHAVAREAIRLGFEHHKTIATRLRGVKVERALADIFEQSLAETYIEMIKIGIIVGTGGLLSHAPRRAQSLMILMDAFQPVGVTRMFQDSVFMMPHLGVLSTVYPEAAWQIFDKDCLLRLGTVIAPLGEAKDGEKVMEVRLETQSGESEARQMNFGEISSISLGEGKEADIIISPAKEFDVGAGRGKALETKVKGGVVGVVLDARGRPMNLPEEKRKETLLRWISSLSLYPDAQMRDLAEA